MDLFKLIIFMSFLIFLKILSQSTSPSGVAAIPITALENVGCCTNQKTKNNSQNSTKTVKSDVTEVVTINVMVLDNDYDYDDYDDDDDNDDDNDNELDNDVCDITKPTKIYRLEFMTNQYAIITMRRQILSYLDRIYGKNQRKKLKSSFFKKY